MAEVSREIDILDNDLTAGPQRTHQALERSARLRQMGEEEPPEGEVVHRLLLELRHALGTEDRVPIEADGLLPGERQAALVHVDADHLSGGADSACDLEGDGPYAASGIEALHAPLQLDPPQERFRRRPFDASEEPKSLRSLFSAPEHVRARLPRFHAITPPRHV
jgi:hypothetical protein